MKRFTVVPAIRREPKACRQTILLNLFIDMNKFGANIDFYVFDLSKEKDIIKELIDQQYLLEKERSYVLSQQGLLFADAISERLFRVS